MSVREPDPIGADLRRERRRRDLKGAVCALCGKDDPLRLEVHEPGGRANDPETRVVLCQLCHRLQSARQPELGVDLAHDPDRSWLERLVSWLRGLAGMFESLAESCAWWADRLVQLLDYLDKRYPQWRQNPGA